MSERRMELREYRQVCEKKNGKKSIQNESLLRSIDRATGGRRLTKKEFDQVHAKIKIGQQVKKEQ
ncbi:MAG: hypothetical protein V3W37_08575 [Candidatus Binatia bacterium]